MHILIIIILTMNKQKSILPLSQFFNIIKSIQNRYYSLAYAKIYLASQNDYDKINESSSIIRHYDFECESVAIIQGIANTQLHKKYMEGFIGIRNYASRRFRRTCRQRSNSDYERPSRFSRTQDRNLERNMHLSKLSCQSERSKAKDSSYRPLSTRSNSRDKYGINQLIGELYDKIQMFGDSNHSRKQSIMINNPEIVAKEDLVGNNQGEGRKQYPQKSDLIANDRSQLTNKGNKRLSLRENRNRAKEIIVSKIQVLEDDINSLILVQQNLQQDQKHHMNQFYKTKGLSLVNREVSNRKQLKSCTTKINLPRRKHEQEWLRIA